MRKNTWRSALAAGVLGLATITTAPADAQQVAIPTSSDPVSWGVVDRANVGVADDQELIRSIAIIGDVTYVGGFFLNVRPTNGGARTSQPYLAAFNRISGEWISSFTPSVDGPVLEVVASPDGTRLFVGGDFNSVNGNSNASGLVALNPQTGAVQNDFKMDAEWTYNSGTLSVDAMAVDNNYLYVGGNLTHITTNGSGRVRRTRLARISLSNNTIDTSWSPTASGGRVATIALDNAKGRVYVGGQFTTINAAANSQRFAVINMTNDNLTSGVQQGMHVDNFRYLVDPRAQTQLYYYYRFARQDHFPYDIEVFPGYVAWAGDMAIEVMSDSNLSSVYSWSRRDTLNGNCPLDGDVQAVEYHGGYLYWGGHFEQEGTYYAARCATGSPRLLARWSPAGGRDTSFNISWNQPAPTIWALETDPTSGALWVGGAFTQAGNTSVYSLAKFTPGGPGVVDNVRPSQPTGINLTPGNRAASITWTAATDNVAVTGYQIFRSTTAGTVGPLIGTSTNTTFNDTGLTNGTTYYYALKATDAAGNTSWRTGLKAVTPSAGGAVDNVRPSQPTGINLTPGNRAASITWTAATDNVAVTGYQIFRSTTAGTVGPLIGTSTNTTFNDTGLTNGTTYYYALKATDAAGNTSWRTGLKAVTPSAGGAVDNVRPSRPTGINLTPGNRAASITWTAATDNVAVTGYQIFRSTTAGTVGPLIGTSTNTTFNDTGLTNGTTYYYALKATDAAGNTSWRTGLKAVTPSAGGAVDNVRPSRPTGINLTPGNRAASITWTAATDNVAVTGYQIFRSTTAGTVGPLIGTSTNTTFNDTGLTNGTTYYYALKATDAAGNTSWRTGLKAVTPQ